MGFSLHLFGRFLCKWFVCNATWILNWKIRVVFKLYIIIFLITFNLHCIFSNYHKRYNKYYSYYYDRYKYGYCNSTIITTRNWHQIIGITNFLTTWVLFLNMSSNSFHHDKCLYVILFVFFFHYFLFHY